MLGMCCQEGMGLVSSTFSCVEILVALYYAGILKYEDGRDQFVFSKGYANSVLYYIFVELGLLSQKQLKELDHKGGPFVPHLHDTIPGFSAIVASLGMGLGLASGMAYGRKLSRRNGLVFCLVGDAETYEGSIWEAAAFASHNKLNNLVVIMDRNRMGATDFTEDMCSLEPIEDRWKAFGWHVGRGSGHNFDFLLRNLEAVRSRPIDKPIILIADTIKGKGISFMEGEPLWHSRILKGEEAERAKQEMNYENG